MTARVTAEDRAPRFEVIAQAGERRMRLVTSDKEYVKRQMAQFMSPRDNEVPAKWYARLYSQLDKAYRSGSAEFNRFGLQSWVITVRRMNTTDNPDGNGDVNR